MMVGWARDSSTFRGSSALRIESVMYFVSVNIIQVEEKEKGAELDQTRLARQPCGTLREEWRVSFESKLGRGSSTRLKGPTKQVLRLWKSRSES